MEERSTFGARANRDLIGVRGQHFAQLALTEPIGEADALFRVQFLGDKYPTIDLIVELEDAPGSTTPFFFVQVKATRSGYNQAGRLRVQVSRDTLSKLIAYPVPTYIIGVDETGNGISYIVAACQEGPTHYSGFPTTHRLNGQTLRRLYDEVLAFWQTHATIFATSHFT